MAVSVYMSRRCQAHPLPACPLRPSYAPAAFSETCTEFPSERQREEVRGKVWSECAAAACARARKQAGAVNVGGSVARMMAAAGGARRVGSETMVCGNVP